MGQYVNGKWSPTFGDDQFGVVDSPGQMYDRNRELQNEINSLRSQLDARDAEIERLTAERDALRARVEAATRIAETALAKGGNADSLKVSLARIIDGAQP